ncbi:hypothetical protein Agabi119p4_2780 [Agaricus bisporus var. burnettii]|nr:hypothetical protein Agabi119p4_2780 [Agaricus bisporus var. burnettii]
MPSSARKSSISSARRSIQKAHVPYRGDNLEVGKRTGVQIPRIERRSDGFEPFEELLREADKRTPPRVKGIRKSKPAVRQTALDEADGEMSMDIDDSIHLLSSARIPSTPTLRNTSGSSRPVARSSEVDFDDIPSPRTRSSISRSAKAGPSGLSKFTVFQDTLPDSDSDNEPADFGDYGNDMDVSGTTDMNGNFEAEGSLPPSPVQESSPRRKSFSQIDQDLDNQEAGESEPPPSESPPRLDKGKRKAVLEDIQEGDEDGEEDEEREENEIANGLDDLDDEPENNSSPASKKQRVREEEPAKKPRARRSKKENRVYREGIRKSRRERFAPLEYWRGEKVVYGRTESSGPILVPTIKEIRRIPSEPPVPLGIQSRKRKYKKNTINPEEGWDDDTLPNGEVYDMERQCIVERRLVWTEKRLTFQHANEGEWSYERIFGDSEFLAAGQILIPPDCRKPSKGTNDNTYIFYVVQGAVNFKIHETSKVVATGGSFIAPRGNRYFIENISNRDARLFFTQARKVPLPDNERESFPPSMRKKSLEEVRSSSPGLASAAARTARSLPPATHNRQQTTMKKRAPSAKV